MLKKYGGREIYPLLYLPLSVDNKRINGPRPKITQPVVLREEEEGEVRTKERKIACEKTLVKCWGRVQIFKSLKGPLIWTLR